MHSPKFKRHDDLSESLGKDYFLAAQVDFSTLASDLAALPGPCIVDLRLLGEDIDNSRTLLQLGFAKICVLAIFSAELPEAAPAEPAAPGPENSPETAVFRDAAWIERHAHNLRLGCFALNPNIPGESWLAVHRNMVEKSLASPRVLKFFQDDGFVSFRVHEDKAVIDFFSAVNRRQGTGSALMARLFAFARTQRVRSIEVVTECENIPACLFYQKNNFRLAQTAVIFHYHKN
ncbi:MAG: GNAT family N-acetyltransferase [Desulfovibrionaceae bacterium]|nr:GNAT family N-acetyltransferase [Desulfovibrionaceae bacterium]MBF0515144.1 GNAT family N-acetyltransferase [Desulfovibrionaceae bacterium]